MEVAGGGMKEGRFGGLSMEKGENSGEKREPLSLELDWIRRKKVTSNNPLNQQTQYQVMCDIRF